MNTTATTTNRVHPRHAFTLVELLVVITIIGIIAGLALPALYGVFTRGKATAMRMEVESLTNAIEEYRSKYGDYPPDFSDWNVVQRHYRKAFPRMLPGELLRLQFLTDVDTSNDTATSGTAAAHDPTKMDRAEAIVWALGGFSSNPQLPFTGAGGPLEQISATATAVVFQVNLDRDNRLFDFDNSKMNLSKVDSAATISLTNRYESLEDNDLFPAYGATKENAPYVYFDARTYRFNAGTDAAPNFNGYASTDFGQVRPYVSAIANARSGSPPPAFVSRVEALSSWQFVNEDSFQIISPGLDGVFGTRANHDVDGDSTDDPIYFQYPTGKAIAGVYGSSYTLPGDLLVPNVNSFQETSVFGAAIENQTDNITSFSNVQIGDDVKEGA